MTYDVRLVRMLCHLFLVVVSLLEEILVQLRSQGDVSGVLVGDYAWDEIGIEEGQSEIDREIGRVGREWVRETEGGRGSGRGR